MYNRTSNLEVSRWKVRHAELHDREWTAQKKECRAGEQINGHTKSDHSRQTLDSG